MHPTMFKLPFLPEWLADVKSYGVLMMIAFLTGIWMACRRAMRSRANPDIVLNVGFIALICGVAGARAMFVLHYWNERFANQPSPVLAILDIRAGGLEFWGGPLLVIPAVAVYLRYIAKASARWYLDITMPSLAWGLAITRIGCFLNGCCWGAICVDQHDPAKERAAQPWAVRFPYGSPAVSQQYEFGQLTLPKELIYVVPSGQSQPFPLEWIDKLIEDGGATLQKLRDREAEARRRYEEPKNAGADDATLKALDAQVQSAGKALLNHLGDTTLGVAEAQCYKYGLTPQEFRQLAVSYRSKPVHPTQLYETISGLIIYGVLALVFYYRRRHGVVMGWFLVLYSISRILLELLREDNPLDTFGLTISQGISLLMLIAGSVWLWLVYAKLPPISPRAVPYEPPEEPQPAKAKK